MLSRSVAVGSLLIVSFTGSVWAQNIRYTDDDASSGGDGLTWSTAYDDLQNALTEALGDPTITEIRVGAGTYVPSPPGEPQPLRAATFQLMNGVTLSGGFAGLADPNEPDIRDLELHESVLSGDTGAQDNKSDNCYHVLYHPEGLNLNETAVLDGFTVTAGNANGSPPHDAGGGMHNCDHSSPTVINCTFTGNSAKKDGGGMCNYNHSSPTVINCTFNRNSANAGGGMYNVGGLPTVTNSIFGRNSANAGGGMYTHGGTPTVTNCTFCGNTADKGGAMYSKHTSASVSNCTFNGNRAYYGGGAMFNYRAILNGVPLAVTNCILWENTPTEIHNDLSYPEVSCSCLRGGYSGERNIAGDPSFVDPGYWNDNGTPDDLDDDFWVNGDYHLQAGSPCINAGDNEAVPANVATDFEGDDRIQQCRVDIGVDETPYIGSDCNSNGVGDACDIEEVTSADCNTNGIPDECEPGGLQDCNGNGIPDLCDIHGGASLDCNGNAVPDECDSPLATGTLYVDHTATDGANDGSSWADAYWELSDALRHAGCMPGAVTEIRVAQGTYMPVPTDLNHQSLAAFQLVNGVGVYGGFPTAGGDGTFEDRDPALYKTSLSGAIGISDSSDDNCYHVFYHPEGLNLDETAVIEGFVITNGNANHSCPHDTGGGMYNCDSSPRVTNCTFRNNKAALGGGMDNCRSSPVLTNCSFVANRAEAAGGGMRNSDCSNPMVRDCTFSSNLSESCAGMSNSLSSPTVTNCVFSDNIATRVGGAVCNGDGTPTFADCTFTNNEAGCGGGAMSNSNGTISTLVRCDFLTNSTSGSFGIGGAMHNGGADTLLFACVFQGNTATSGGAVFSEADSIWTGVNCLFNGNLAGSGGAVWNHTSRPTLLNCTVTYNHAVAGGGMYNVEQYGGDITLTNCLLWGNSDVNGTSESAQLYERSTEFDARFYVDYSCIQGWTGQLGGVGNTGADPLFVDSIGPDGIAGTDDDDLTLSHGSPCIDAGDNTAVPPDEADLDDDGDTTEPIPLDFAGRDRFVNNPGTPDTGNPSPEIPDRIVDMGAYEFPRCGDGVVDYSEECDGGGIDTSTCDSDCTFAHCGDGTLNTVANEECDDGNPVFGDGCNPYCRIEPGGIPTVTGWGLTVMLLLLLTGAKIYFDNRRRFPAA